MVAAAVAFDVTGAKISDWFPAVVAVEVKMLTVVPKTEITVPVKAADPAVVVTGMPG